VIAFDLLILGYCLMMGSGGRVLGGSRRALMRWRRALMRCAGASVYSDAVDIFNATSGRWTTAALSKARSYLVATSLPNQGVAIFAGGGTGL
jgi:hypothetical protein